MFLTAVWRAAIYDILLDVIVCGGKQYSEYVAVQIHMELAQRVTDAAIWPFTQLAA